MPRTEELQIIPARMLNEFVYCARLYYYEHVIGEFEDNADTVEGRYRHRRVDQETGTPPSPEALDIPESEDGAQKTLVSTSVWLEAPLLGATCKIDRLEIRDGLAVPVDYKRGKKPDVPGGAWGAGTVSISYLTYGGWFVGMARGGEHKNVGLRIRQHRWAEDSTRSLELAREFVRGKILNSRTMLRRNHAEAPEAVLLELKRLAASTSRSKDLGSLLGTEGAAAKVYFRSFPGMLKSELPEFDFQGRNRRPPRDPINALLSFAYSLLTRELTVITASVGFDPYRGFFHQSKYGKPALALDLMEEFRPLIADSVVLQVVNNGEIQANDFVYRAGACALLPNARRKFIEAYERRMTTSVTHPIFDYSASYRRILEIQARLLGRLLQGEIERYPAFRTR